MDNEWGPFNKNLSYNNNTKNVFVLPQNTMDLFCATDSRTIQNRTDIYRRKVEG